MFHQSSIKILLYVIDINRRQPFSDSTFLRHSLALVALVVLKLLGTGTSGRIATKTAILAPNVVAVAIMIDSVSPRRWG